MARPDDDRCNVKPRSGRIVIELTENVLGRELKPYLFFEFSQGRLAGIFSGVQTSAGKCPLPGMVSKLASASRNDKACFAVIAIGQSECYSGGRLLSDRLRAPLEALKVPFDLASKCIVEFNSCGRHRGRVLHLGLVGAGRKILEPANE